MTTRRERWRGARQRWRHSLQWRLVTLFLLLALCTTAVFLLGMQRVLHTGWQAYAKPLVADYVDKLAAEVGSPPDPERARAIAARLPLTVRIDGPQVRFDSHPEARYRGHHHEPEDGGDDWGLSRSSADGHRIRFGLAGPPPAERPRLFGLVTLALLLLLTAGAFAVVHKLLRPLGDIGAGVARFGRGDFSQPITVRRRDELGALADRINTMAQSLQGMLDAKRALLLAMSHELRSPLTRARVNAELIDDSEPRQALLRDLGEMRDLIGDLLESERLAQGHAALSAEPVELPALVRELVSTRFAGAGVSLQLDDGIGPVSADPLRLKLLLRNLIDNALRHGAGAAQPPVVSWRRDGEGRFELAVRDFGAGISEEQLPLLAEAFYRPDSARQRATGGVGLGLYLCRLVAEAHGGSLRIRRADPGLAVTMVWGGGRDSAAVNSPGASGAGPQQEPSR